ncbi:hypothetical protein [Marinicrinis lubricantis]|uniref:Uncharacterized protein n=1 Tax=Marinicrinis lubricantis TaxID=2086470 RepID=A0ABW1IT00_9BACL
MDSTAKTKEIKGFTYEEFNRLKEIGEQARVSGSGNIVTNSAQSSNDVIIFDHWEQCPTTSGATEMCGAYDNYYNHNTSTGKYTIQTITYDPKGSIYNKISGTTIGHAKTAGLLGEYKAKINNYDEYTQRRMDGLHWSEVAGWASGLASMVILVATFSAGPTGWAAAVSQAAAEAFIALIGLTSSTYTTYTRLSYSGTAAAYLHEANMKHASIMNTGEYDSSTWVVGL